MTGISKKNFTNPDETRAPDKTRHVGTLISGRLHVTHTDGGELDIGAGDAYVIEPGHDAWVTSDEPVVGYEFEPATAQMYARGQG